MPNRLRHQKKYQDDLIPLIGGFIGFVVGISGISNHLILVEPENFFKDKLVDVPQEVTSLSFTGFRVLFLTYIGISAGLVANNQLANKTKSRQKN